MADGYYKITTIASPTGKPKYIAFCGVTISGKIQTSKTEPQYTFDVSSASYVRLGLVLSSSKISAEDTANLVITGK